MTGFRGSDETLDREIATLETIARLRLRRAAADFAELERELRSLRAERVRRKSERVGAVARSAASGEASA